MNARKVLRVQNPAKTLSEEFKKVRIIISDKLNERIEESKNDKTFE